MGNRVVVETFAKLTHTLSYVETARDKRLSIPGVISSVISQDDTDYILTTTYPDPNVE